MNAETVTKIINKVPFLKEIVTTCAIIVALFGLVVGCFFMEQMFDDKHRYDSGSTVTDFINWFCDTTTEAIKPSEAK